MAILRKLRLTSEEDGTFEEVMSISLTHFPTIRKISQELKQDESIIITDRALTYKDKVITIESDDDFNLIKNYIS